MRKHAKPTKTEATVEYLHEKGVHPVELAADALIVTGMVATTEASEVASELVVTVEEVENFVTVYSLHVKSKVKWMLRH